jgi:hypothetical protein
MIWKTNHDSQFDRDKSIRKPGTYGPLVSFGKGSRGGARSLPSRISLGSVG